MSVFDDVEQFVRLANRLTSLDEIRELLSSVARTLGFDHVALGHLVDVNRTLSPSEAVQFATYPDAWRAMVRDRGYFADDPVLAACQVSAAGFRWSDLPRLVEMTERQQGIMRDAANNGLTDGFTVPVNVPGEFLGCCSFAIGSGRELPRATLPAAQYVGCFAFEAARRIRRYSGARCGQGGPPRLTQRQFDCVVLAAQGRSDWHIGQLLGISSQTVHQHIESAKRRYGVASRTQLVVRALFDSQITFADVIR